MKLRIQRNQSGQSEVVEYEYRAAESSQERPTALEVLLQAQERELPDLAFRYGCRNALCGVCTIEVNGRPRLACRQKVKPGDELGALKALPAFQDFVVDRAPINRALRSVASAASVRPASGEEQAQSNRLNRCIECYACLDGCPLHERNQNEAGDAGAVRSGNPYLFLKLQRARIPASAANTAAAPALKAALDLGLEVCRSCAGCKCGIGINLKADVIEPLLNASDPGRRSVD